MYNKNISRRKFFNLSAKGIIAGVGASLILPQLGNAANSTKGNSVAKNPSIKITAGDLIERIKLNVGVPWRKTTVDVIKAGGNPDTIVTGITTTFMATLDVLQKSVKAGNNFIISHEPIFWNNLDTDEGLTNDPMYLHKLDYIKKNQLIVFRFHDHWHSRKPDGINEGFYRELGWDKYKYDEAHGIFELPQTQTLETFAKEVKNRLKNDSIRVVGNPKMKVGLVGKGPNKLSASTADQMPFADVFIIKEADRENDLVEWCRDLAISGRDKGFIFLSHHIGEAAGMENCARWVRTFTPELSVQFIPSGEPFWRTLKA